MSDQIAVRMRPRDIKLVKTVCKACGEQVSDFVRRAIKRELAHLNYLGPREKKALGLKQEY